MATRTLPSAKERIATMMGAPLMTCSARLPVYVLLIGILVPASARLGPFTVREVVMFGLYLLGAVSAMAAAWVFRRIAERGHPTLPFYLKMPPYRMPTLRAVLVSVWDAARAFLRKVTTIILLTTAVLWVLLNLPAQSVQELTAAGVDPDDHDAVAAYTLDHSYAAAVGRGVDPSSPRWASTGGSTLRCSRPCPHARRSWPRWARMAAAESPGDPDAVADMRFTDGPNEGELVLDPAHAGRAARVLRLCPPVHVDGRDHASRGGFLALAGRPSRSATCSCSPGPWAGWRTPWSPGWWADDPAAPREVAGRTDRLRWVVPAGTVDLCGPVAVVPGALGDLVAAGVLASVVVEPDAVVLTLGPGHRLGLATGRGCGPRCTWRSRTPPAWLPAPGAVRLGADALLARLAHDVLAGPAGDYVRSHGGGVELADAHDGVVRVRLSGACRGYWVDASPKAASSEGACAASPRAAAPATSERDRDSE